MSKHTVHAHIAGEVVASGKRPATEVATRIIELLASDGYRIVPASQPDAMKVLILLNSAFDLSGAGIEGLSEILARLPPSLQTSTPEASVARPATGALQFDHLHT